MQILLVEDNPADVLFLREALAGETLAEFDLAVAESLGEALALLSAQTFAAALLDLGLPDSQGLPTFLKLHQSAPDLPVVVLSALADEEVATQAIQAGAQDYLIKRPQDFLSAGRAVRYAIERQKISAKLLASEEKFHSVVACTPNIIFTVDRQYLIQFINRVPAGLTTEEAIGTSALGYVQPEYRGCVEEAIRSVFETGRETSYEIQARGPNETVAWFSTRLASLNRGAADEQVLLITQDITERKQAFEKLRESEENYRGLIETLDSVVATMDFDGNILYLNEVAAQQWGSTRQALTGKALHELFPEPVAAQQLAIVRHVIQTDRGHVSETLGSVQGRPRWYRSSFQPIHDERGRAAYALLHATDVHELKSTQQALAELNRTLEERVKKATAEIEDLYENAPAGYHSLDGDGKIVRINQTELNWLGYSREELLGQPLTKLLTPSSLTAFQATYPQFKQCGRLQDLELEFVRKDGTILDTVVNASAVQDDNGVFLMSRSTVFDVTHRRQAENALRESEAQLRISRDKLSAANAALEKAARMKDEFLASMSHELRTPLTGILVLSESMQLNTYGMLTTRQYEVLKHIEESGHHLLNLINDILDLSKIEAGMLELTIEPVSLAEICQASLQLTKGMAHKKQQSVSFAMSPNNIQVRGDARRLKQLLVNLLSNAIKFTPRNGSLGLEVQADQAGQVVRLTVWDAGIGIAPENLERLFQPFVQLESSLARQYEGTGLGLSLVQRMAELHGGSVQVESALGQGSRFTILLPWMPAEPLPISGSGRGALFPKKVLLVAGGAIDTELITRYLLILGIDAQLHSLDQGTVDAAAREQPDMILLDLHLLNQPGLEFLAGIKANTNTQDIPVIICSVEEKRSQAAVLGAAGYLVKPFVINDLHSEIARAASLSTHNAASTPPSRSPQPLVLIVDDNELTIDTIGDYLQLRDFHVVTVRSGAELLDVVADLQPDLILMDIQMPVMDGFEATRRVRSHPDPRVARVPIIALTAVAMSGDRERCLAAGANGYMSKPVALKQLVEAIHGLLERA